MGLVDGAQPHTAARRQPGGQHLQLVGEVERHRAVGVDGAVGVCGHTVVAQIRATELLRSPLTAVPRMLDQV